MAYHHVGEATQKDDARLARIYLFILLRDTIKRQLIDESQENDEFKRGVTEVVKLINRMIDATS